MMCSCAKTISPFDKSWIIKVDGEKVSSEIYSYYVYSAYEMYSYYGLIDPAVSLKKQYITLDGGEGKETRKRADKQINEYALDKTVSLYYLQKQYEQSGLVTDEQTAAQLKEVAAYEYDAYRAMFEKNGISEETVLLAGAGGMATQMAEELFIKDTADIPEQEILDYYHENYVSYAYVSQKMLDEGGIPLDDSDKDVYRKELAEVAEKVKTGSVDISDLALEYIKDASADPKCGKGGKNISTVEWGESDLMSELKNMAPGEVKYVEIKNCGYVIKRFDLDQNGFYSDEGNRLLVLKNMKYDDWSENFYKNLSDLSYTLNVSAYNKHGINNFKSEDDGK